MLGVPAFPNGGHLFPHKRPDDLSGGLSGSFGLCVNTIVMRHMFGKILAKP
jgi:hypothetical protein